ncbi:hypothetical protein [Mesorhizobium sp. NZP2077]|uniref:hypothetical protein n=1 Tax=Mesorhizobium sp. NZP2077 TaxID=2483404 RepID=UPI001552D8F1|nr:hypothetical protein [Mesorhizobium sp. NZP2077]QKC83295.1 hypothetical protein EB232_18210 [Mesorhizobium sp. NZP2077]QKD16812.1 hypothetical protein HGP13_17995 [Mesorhizobium sp. NZP2077]
MDQDHGNRHISAFDFDIVRNAFRKSVIELNMAEEHWAKHARLLLKDFTDCEPDETIINRIIGR